MPLKRDGHTNLHTRFASPLRIFVMSLLMNTALTAPDLSAQERSLGIAAEIAATGIFSAGIIRQVPHSSGGDRMTRVPDVPAFSVGLSFSTGDLPFAIRLTAVRSVGAPLEYKEYRTQSCGRSCTRTSGMYVFAGDASATLVAADLVWTPPSPWIVRPQLLAGVGQKIFAYDRSDLSSDLEPYFRSSDVTLGLRFGVGLTSTLDGGVQGFAELLQQRSMGAPRIPEIGEFWLQRDLLFSAGVRVRIR